MEHEKVVLQKKKRKRRRRGRRRRTNDEDDDNNCPHLALITIIILRIHPCLHKPVLSRFAVTIPGT